MAIPTHFPLKLVGRTLVLSVAHLSFVRDDGQPLDFIPGQSECISTTLTTARTKRSYSLATIHAPGPGEAVEIAVSYVAAARPPHCLRAWKRAVTAAPMMLLPDAGDANPRYLLIGTGTAPHAYRAMLPLLEQHRRSATCRSCCCSARARAGGWRIREPPSSQLPVFDSSPPVARTACQRASRCAPWLRTVPRGIRHHTHRCSLVRQPEHGRCSSRC